MVGTNNPRLFRFTFKPVENRFGEYIISRSSGNTCYCGMQVLAKKSKDPDNGLLVLTNGWGKIVFHLKFKVNWARYLSPPQYDTIFLI